MSDGPRTSEGQRVPGPLGLLHPLRTGDEHRCGFTSAAKWKSFENGSKWVGQTGMIGGDLKCDKLEKAK